MCGVVISDGDLVWPQLALVEQAGGAHQQRHAELAGRLGHVGLVVEAAATKVVQNLLARQPALPRVERVPAHPVLQRVLHLA